MSGKRKDDDERRATAIIHIVEALRDEIREAAENHLAEAERNANIILNRGKDQWHQDYRTTTVTPPAKPEPAGTVKRR